MSISSRKRSILNMGSQLNIVKIWIVTLVLLFFSSCSSIHGVTAAFNQPWGLSYRKHQMIRSCRLLRSRASEYDEPSVAKEIIDDDVGMVRKYTEEALEWRGEDRGLRALEHLGGLCAERKPFDFSAKRIHAEGSVLRKIPELIPLEVTKDVLTRVQRMQDRGWLSTNPDSVDGLPSFHLNLISNSTPVVDMSPGVEMGEFHSALRDLTAAVSPYVYNRLLPQAHDLMNTTSILVSDVFIRRYGEDVIDGNSRNSISAHYDVFSKVTSVIALDDVAKDGTNGLFTTAVVPRGDEEGSPGTTSNHASLRRYFPISCGDGVVHTWDVLHGVDVEPGVDRTSLIVWFTSDEGEGASDVPNASWLPIRRDLDENDVAQFVLASALESSYSYSQSSTPAATDSMHLHSPANNGGRAPRKFQKLYLESASRGNAFALSRLGNLCGDYELDPVLKNRAAAVLASVSHSGSKSKWMENDDIPISDLAKGFWWEGAIRGSPNAQMALADELMSEASESGEEDQRLLAAVLFGLAAQQGSHQAAEALHRVIQFELAQCNVESEHEFLKLPVVRVAMAAISA